MKNLLKTFLLVAVLLLPTTALAVPETVPMYRETSNNVYYIWPVGSISRARLVVGSTTPYGQLTVTASSSLATTQLFAVASSTGTYLFNVLGNGNVGLGTTTPGTLFSLGNTGAATSNFSVTGTSTLATGLNLKTGCITYNGGACLGTGGGSSIDVGTGIVTQTGVGTFAGRTITTTGLNGLSITNGNGVSGNPVINISNLYEGQTSIITLGTIVTGAWNANTIMPAYGGTGSSSFGQGWLHTAGGTSNFTSSTSPTVNYITATSTTRASSLPYASSTAITVSGAAYFPSTNGIWNSTGIGLGITPTVPFQISVSNSGSNLMTLRNTAADGFGGFDIKDNSDNLALQFGYGNSSAGFGLANVGYMGTRKSGERLMFITGGLNDRGGISGTGLWGVATSSPWRQLSVTGTVAIDGLTTAAGTPSSVCMNATTKEVTLNAATSCLVSARDQKQNIKALTVSGLDTIMALNPVSFEYKDQPNRERWGFIADEMQGVNHALGDGYNTPGRDPNEARTVDIPATTAALVKAVQEQQKEIEMLKAEIKILKK